MHRFARKYTPADVELLAAVDEAHETAQRPGQGDPQGEGGCSNLYSPNAQNQAVNCFEIEAWLEPLLKAMIEQFPFRVLARNPQEKPLTH